MTLNLSYLKRVVWKTNSYITILERSKGPYKVAPDALENASQSCVQFYFSEFQ